MKNVLVVSNYNSGRKQAILHKKSVQKFLLKNCEKFKFISIEDFNNADIKEFDTIFAMGGDGTVSKIISYIKDTDKALYIVPVGTANLLASKLGLSVKIKKHKIKKIDILKINDNDCALRCGFGYDADIICKTPQSLKNKFGYFAYFITGVIFALRLKNREYKIKLDNTERKILASCIIFANASNMYKNIVSLADNSSLDDGLFDVFILKTANPVLFFIEFLRIISGIRKTSKRAEYTKAKNAEIENTGVFCHIDGEKKHIKEKIIISVKQQAVNVFLKD